MIIGLGGDVRSSSKWASPSIIKELAPQRTLFPIMIFFKHHMDVPLNPQSFPILSSQDESTGVVEKNTSMVQPYAV